LVVSIFTFFRHLSTSPQTTKKKHKKETKSTHKNPFQKLPLNPYQNPHEFQKPTQNRKRIARPHKNRKNSYLRRQIFNQDVVRFTYRIIVVVL